MIIPKVSIIFPNFNGGQKLLDCLSSIYNLNFPKHSFEVIVIDNHSTDRSVNLVKIKFPKVKILNFKKNLGFSKEINFAASIASGIYLFITNNDVIFDRECLSRLFIYIDNHPNVAIVGPVSYLDKEYSQLDSAVQKYSLTTGLFSSTLSQKPTNSAWISGSGLFISRDSWQFLGGFDEHFYFYYEDIDLAIRAKKLGYNIMCLPKAKIFHARGSTAHLPQNRFFRYFNLHKSRQQLLIKHGTFWQILVGFFLQLFVFSWYHGIILRDRSVFPMIKATIINLKFSEIKKNLRIRKKYKQWLKEKSTLVS